MRNSKFLWGNSVSSMQTEGAWNVDGKGPSVYDVKQATPDSSDWKDGIDEYHRYEEDFDLMKNAGMNCYRFQVSWSRVIPSGDGTVNQKGLDYYSRFVDALLERKMVPVICLYHFDMPLPLAKKENGFISDHVREAFVRFAKIVVKALADKVQYWIPFNEQNCTMFEEGFQNSGYLTGAHSIADQYKIATNSLIAYAEVADFIHQFPGLQVGGMVAYQEMYPNSPKPEDVMVTRKANEFINEDFLSFFATGKRSREVTRYIAAQGWPELNRAVDLVVTHLTNVKSDFLAFSYYYSLVIDANRIKPGTPPNYYMSQGKIFNPNLETSEYGWQIDALGFRNCITKMADRYNLPIFPVENGIGEKEVWDGAVPIQDDYRIQYHQTHIQAMKDAMTIDGADVIGYLGWGLIDIPSSTGNMEKRYGIVYVNRGNHDLRDLRRVPKKSYQWFKKMIAENKNLNGEVQK